MAIAGGGGNALNVGGVGSITGSPMVDGIGNGVASLLGMASGIIGYYSQNSQMSAQLHMAKQQYAHQEVVALMTKKGEIERQGMTMQLQQAVADGQVKLNKAIEKRVGAEAQSAISDARIEQDKLTAKTAKVNTPALDQYFYGNPSKRLNPARVVRG